MSYLAIEGLIGSGKTTLARRMASQLQWRLLEEPVAGNALLEDFYVAPERLAFALQIKMLHCRYAQQQVAAHSTEPCVLDRSMVGDRCFCALHSRYRNILPREQEVYEECYDVMTAVRPPFLMVYLEVDPEVALSRIHQRGRPMEQQMTLRYLQDLDAEYEQTMQQIAAGTHAWSRGIELWRVPWNDQHTDPSQNAAYQDLVERARRYVGHP